MIEEVFDLSRLLGLSQQSTQPVSAQPVELASIPIAFPVLFVSNIMDEISNMLEYVYNFLSSQVAPLISIPINAVQNLLILFIALAFAVAAKRSVSRFTSAMFSTARNVINILVPKIYNLLEELKR